MNKDKWLHDAFRSGILDAGIYTGLIYRRKNNEYVPVKTRLSRGYKIFTITIQGVERTCYLHRAIWIKWHGIPEEGMTINHIDCNKQNNSVLNLEMVTPQENKKHSVDNKTHAHGDTHGCSKLTEVQVREIKRDYIPWKNGCRRLARKYGVYRTTISKIIAGETWKHVKI